MAIHCQAQHRRGTLVLGNAHFALNLRTEVALRAHQWLDRRTGKKISLGDGPEVELDLDDAERRIHITGWRGKKADAWARGDFHRREFDDSKWSGNINPAMFWHSGESVCYWTRTHVFLPADYSRKPLTLVLGGLGAFDFRFMRVFVNGHILDVRWLRGFWHEPGKFDLGRIRKHLRFGLDNVIALQLAKPMRQTPWLAECDSHESRHLPWLFSYPGHFEQYIVVGRQLQTPKLTLRQVRILREGHVSCELRSDNPRLDVKVEYRWRANEPTLHKTVNVTNADKAPIRLLSVHLGRYRTNVKVSEGGQGFPVYLDNALYVSLAHPAGWAMGENGRVQLRQYPGTMLAPGGTFTSMETVFGVGGRPSFLQHVRQRMRRVRRGCDKPVTIFEAFGGYKIPPPNWLQDWVDEKTILTNMRGLEQFQRETGYRFDHYSIEFWNAKDGDFMEPDRRHFPRGFEKVLLRLKPLRTTAGLWFPFTASGNWGICGNPAVSESRTSDPAYVTGKPSLCLASEPVKSLYQTAMCHHARANGVRLLKPDGLMNICHNPTHDHLPGLYSTEAIHNAAIEMLRAVNRVAPQTFLMLYWGFRSPWWLLHGDTLFEPGLCMEASNPGEQPTLYIRDSVTQALDQAQWFCRDVPPLGKDSLGVWLSDWGWNSGIGRERWEEAFVMDMCRGSLLAQPWSDLTFLDRAGRKQIAEFIALLRAQPKCFANPHFILGNPWKNEPYGYACSDGKRTFLALNNCTWQDQRLPIDIAGKDVYRWYPQPARLIGDTTHMALRPFDVVLLEVVPAGHKSSLSRNFPPRAISSTFTEPSRIVSLSCSVLKHATALRVPIESEKEVRPSAPRAPKRVVQVKGRVPASRRGGTLMVALRFSKGGRSFALNETGKFFAVRGSFMATPVVPYNCHPCAWQAWRIRVPASPPSLSIKLQITAMLADEVDVSCEGHFIPN